MRNRFQNGFRERKSGTQRDEVEGKRETGRKREHIVQRQKESRRHRNFSPSSTSCFRLVPQKRQVGLWEEFWKSVQPKAFENR